MLNNKNLVKLSGYLNKEFELSHEARGERYFCTELAVKRKSGEIDYIPLMMPEVLTEGLVAYQYIELSGQFRSFNVQVEEKRLLMLNVFVREVSSAEETAADINLISMEGYLCKKPSYRETPLGRQISDMLVAVNRDDYGRSDYIPCIAWGRNALRAARLDVGTKLNLKGRIQSRRYTKNFEDGSSIEKMAYEVSISEMFWENSVSNSKE